MKLSKLSFLCLLAFSFLNVHSYADTEEEPGNQLFGPPGMQIRGGLTGSYWKPKGIAPYEVDTYSRAYAYLELRVLHPLLIFGEGFDILDVPRLGIETNLGYSNRSETLHENLPSFIRNSPYLKTFAWTTFLHFFSFRWENESFDINMNDPTMFWGSDGELVSVADYDYKSEQNEIMIGIIGSTDGEVHPTMIEIGYFSSSWQRPIAMYLNGIDAKPNLILTHLNFKGLYLGLTTEPIEKIWPLESFVGFRFGSGNLDTHSTATPRFLDPEDNLFTLLGLDIRLNFTRPVTKRARLGVKFDISYNIISGDYEVDNEEISRIRSNPSEVRYRISAFAIYQLFN